MDQNKLKEIGFENFFCGSHNSFDLKINDFIICLNQNFKTKEYECYIIQHWDCGTGSDEILLKENCTIEFVEQLANLLRK